MRQATLRPWRALAVPRHALAVCQGCGSAVGPESFRDTRKCRQRPGRTCPFRNGFHCGACLALAALARPDVSLGTLYLTNQPSTCT